MVGGLGSPPHQYPLNTDQRNAGPLSVRKKVVCRTATNVAVGSKCEIAAARSRCPPLQESVRNLDLDVCGVKLNEQMFKIQEDEIC